MNVKKQKPRKKSTRKSYKSDTIKKEQKRTKEKQKLFLQLFSEEKACNVSLTCKAVNICRDTYYDWVNKYPKFAKACRDAEESLIDFAETQLMVNIKAGKETSLIFFLCNKGKKRGWQHVQKIEHGSDPDNPFTITVKGDLSKYPKATQEKESEQ